MVSLDTLHVRHSQRAKRLSLRANPKTQQVELVIPPLTSRFAINRFIKKNQDWIINRQDNFPAKTVIKDGGMILFRGQKTPIKIEQHRHRTTYITLENSTIFIKTSREDVTQNLKRWIISEAREKITDLAHAKAKKINKTISKIDLRDPSSRWGSCSSDERIMLSWRLIMAPPFILDYVIGHEVAHLQHMNHSPQFWNLCYQLTESPEKARQWLKQHGNELLAVF